MNSAEKNLKKYNTLIYKLFDIVLNLNEEQQLILLKHAEELFARERRTGIRKSCHIPVHYATYDRVFSNYIKNISRNGLFIETQRPLFVGEEILMTFSVKGVDKPIKIKGEVAHASRSGIGVEFKGISADTVEMLSLLIDRMKE
jgi:type IV pilus assembly protein PilZ